MKSLKKYLNKSPLMDVRIKYGSEVFKFNLYEELIIDENKINTELQEQPSYYGFMGLLLIKLQRSKDDAEAELNKITAKLFIKYKTDINNNTGRENSEKLAEALVEDSDEFNEATKKLNKLKESVGIIKQCLLSFEQRSSLIQSLSANRRKEI